MEGIPGHLEASTVTRGADVGLGGSLPLGSRATSAMRTRGTTEAKASGARGKEREATGMSETDCILHRGKTTPTLANRNREAKVARLVFDDGPSKRSRTV